MGQAREADLRLEALPALLQAWNSVVADKLVPVRERMEHATEGSRGSPQLRLEAPR
jgi:hypothetical protein